MRTVRNRLKSLVKSIDKGSLVLEAGRKVWRCYEMDITKLVWSRNLCDGWDISIYMYNQRGFKDHIGSIKIDSGDVTISDMNKFEDVTIKNAIS